MSITAAARVLELTARQVQRLVKTFQADGVAALRHKSRRQPSNNRYATGIADLAVQLVREHYIDFGPTLAAEKLAANHGLVVSRETLRKGNQRPRLTPHASHARADIDANLPGIGPGVLTCGDNRPGAAFE